MYSTGMTSRSVSYRKLKVDCLNLGIFLLLLFQIYLLSFIIRGSNKGVDWTDESFIFELGSNLEFQHEQTWGFQYFTHFLLALVNFSLLKLRLLRIIIYIVCNYLIARTALKYFTELDMKSIKSKFLIFSISLVPIFFTYAYSSRSIGYNELSAWFSSLIVVCLLTIGLNSKNQIGTKQLLISICLGLLTSSLIFIKFSTGIAFSLITLVVISILKSSLREKLSIFSCFSTGFTLIPVLLQAWTEQATEFYRSLFKVLTSSEVQADNLHSINSILQTYFSQFVIVFFDLLQVSIFPLFFVLILLASVNSDRSVRVRAHLPQFLYLFYFAFLIYNYPFELNNKWESIGNFTIGLFLVNLLFTVYLKLGDFIKRKQCLFLIILNCLPFIQAFGSANPIGGQTMFGNIGVMVTSFIISLRVFQKNLHTAIVLSLATLVTSLISASLIHGTTDGMYRVAPIQQLTSEITNVNSLNGILVTPEDSIRYTWLVDRVSQITENTVFVPLVYAGYNFAFKNTGFSSPWVDDFAPVTFSNLRMSCQSFKLGESSIVVIKPSEVSGDLLPFLNRSLEGCGLRFPDSFKLEGEDPTRAIQVWISKSLF
jgi:hypothetical protein